MGPAGSSFYRGVSGCRFERLYPLEAAARSDSMGAGHGMSV